MVIAIGELSFRWPLALVGLCVPLLLAVWHFVAARGSRRRVAPLGSPTGVARSRSSRRLTALMGHMPFVLLTVGLAALVVGIARPSAIFEIPRREATVILAFDTSGSMTADDVEPSRLGAAQALARDFVEGRPDGTRVGVVTFGSGGLLLARPTTDEMAVIDAIERVVANGPTSMAQGIFASLDAIEEEPISLFESEDDGAVIDLESVDIGFFGSTVIVMFSDGENTTTPDPLELAAVASNAGVPIFSVGVGTAAGTVIEVEGFQLATALETQLLEEIAELTDAAYLPGPGTDDELDVSELYDELDREFTVRGEPTELTGVVGAFGAALLLLGALWSTARFGRAP